MIPTDTAAFRRLVLDVVAIVASILLAFGIDAWWDEFQDAVDTRENLLDIRTEFRAYEAELGSRAERWREAGTAMERLLEATVTPSAVPATTMDTLLHRLTWSSTFDPGTGARDALIASGRLEFIEGRILRARIARWPGVVDEVRDNEVLAREFITLVLMPYLAQRGAPLSRVLSLGRDEGWPGARAQDARAGESYAALVRDPAFAGHVAHRYSLLNLAEYEDALVFVRGLLGDLDEELGLD